MLNPETLMDELNKGTYEDVQVVIAKTLIGILAELQWKNQKESEPKGYYQPKDYDPLGAND